MQSAFQHFGVRAYRVTNPKFLNKTVAELEAMPKEMRVFISRVRHDGAIVEPEPATVIHPGDVVAVMARTEMLMARGTEIGPEVDDKALLDFPQEFLDVVITNKALVGKTLRELAALEFARGVFLRKHLRLGEPMPFTAETRLDRGDVLNLVGAKRDVERAAKELGYADRPAITTDMIFVGLGHLSRGAGRPAHGHDRRTPDHPDGQRRRPGHGPGVRLAAVRPADLRPDPRAGHVGLRHRGPDGLHGRGGPGGGSQLSSPGFRNRGSAWSSWASSSPCCLTSRRFSSGDTS